MLSYDSEMSCQCFRLTEPERESKITAAKSSRRVPKFLLLEEVRVRVARVPYYSLTPLHEVHPEYIAPKNVQLNHRFCPDRIQS